MWQCALCSVLRVHYVQIKNTALQHEAYRLRLISPDRVIGFWWRFYHGCILGQGHPLSSDRQHLSYGDCLEVRGEIIRTFLCCIVYWKLCTVISTLRWTVLTVLWIGFCITGPISLCLDSCAYVFFALYCHTAYVLYYCNTVGWTW